MQNLIALLKDELSDALIEKIAGFLGENKSGGRSTVGSALPAILLGLMKKVTEPGGADAALAVAEDAVQLAPGTQGRASATEDVVAEDGG